MRRTSGEFGAGNESDHDGNGGERRAGEQQRQILPVERSERAEPERQRVLVLVEEVDERIDEVGPADDEREHGDRGRHGTNQRHRDAKPKAERPCAVHAGRVEQLTRQAVERPPVEDDVEGRHPEQRGSDERNVRVEDPERPEEGEPWHEQRGRRNHQRDEGERNDGARQARRELRDCEAGPRGEQHRKRNSDSRDEHGVGGVAAEVEELERPRVAGERDGIGEKLGSAWRR
jgi:hypothetical protein